jgi:hypothetical protein
MENIISSVKLIIYNIWQTIVPDVAKGYQSGLKLGMLKETVLVCR